MANNFEKRTDPSETSKIIKSVISLSHIYTTLRLHNLKIQTFRKFPAMHGGEIIKDHKEETQNLCKEINLLSPEINTRAYVDDGPVMDKAWAVRSGIGWMGRIQT